MRDGKKNRMSTEKMEALTSVGSLWTIPRGCSAKLKYIKMNEQCYKVEMARHEGLSLTSIMLSTPFSLQILFLTCHSHLEGR